MGAAGQVVRVARRLVPIEHRCEAGVAALQQRTPFVAAAAGKQLSQAGAHRRPAAAVALGIEQWLVQATALAQHGIELRLQRADGDEFAVGAGIGAVEGCAAVQQVVGAAVAPEAGGLEVEHHGREQSRTVGHRRVDHLALARALRLVDRAHQAEREQHAAATEVADQVQGHRRGLGRADRVQRTADRDVVEVMARGLGKRAVLAPAGHAAIDQLRVAREAGLGPEAHALGHPGAEALDQDVGGPEQVQHQVHALGAPQVDREAVAVAAEVGRVGVGSHRPGARDAQHLGALVGEKHRAERRRPEAGQLDHPQAGERARHQPASCGLNAQGRSRAPGGPGRRGVGAFGSVRIVAPVASSALSRLPHPCRAGRHGPVPDGVLACLQAGLMCGHCNRASTACRRAGCCPCLSAEPT